MSTMQYVNAIYTIDGIVQC